jgi:hypothetical protein
MLLSISGHQLQSPDNVREWLDILGVLLFRLRYKRESNNINNNCNIIQLIRLFLLLYAMSMIINLFTVLHIMTLEENYRGS